MGCFVGFLCPNKHRKEVPIPALENMAKIEGKGNLSVADQSLALIVSEGKFGKYWDNFENYDTVIYLEALLDDSANPSNLVKHSTFGTTFKAHFSEETVVVKRLRDVRISEEIFHELILSITNLKHHNLLPLRAFYYGDQGKFVLYDYMPIGSLSDFLKRDKDEKRVLNWDKRIGIAVGVARAIAHIHSQSTTMFHGNIKASNILLTESLEARVSDLLDHIAVPFPGYTRDMGYCTPGLSSACKLMQEADVYNFGVVLLELLTGKTCGEVDLPRWIVSVVENELTTEVFELDLLQCGNPEEELVRLLQVALSCVAQNPVNRPSMVEVRNRIEELTRSRS